MPKYRDNAPVGNTCRYIDEAIDNIRVMEGYLDESNLIDFERGQSHALSAKEALETIRTANSTLRDWGNELYDEKDDLEDDLKTANSKIADLNYTIDELKSEIENLKEEIKEYENP